MQITITQPCKIDGQDKEVGDHVDLSDNDAMAIVSAGRGTIDPVKGEQVAAAASKAKKAKGE